MMNADEILTRLPPCRDDEPSTLRQDIVDEILDHLDCGIRREILINSSNEILARQRVLERFGDPREVARKLWFQAMWSQIMSQRVVLGSALFSMLICVLVIGMLGWIMHQQQQANAALLENIARLIPVNPPVITASPPVVNMKSHLTARVTRGSTEGEPAAGAIVTVTKLPELGGSSGNDSVTQLVDNSGLVDFGLTPPGRFEIKVRLQSGEFTNYSFFIPEGKEHLEQVVAPDQLPPNGKIELSFTDLIQKSVSRHLEDNKLGLIIRFRPNNVRVVAGRGWRIEGKGLPGVSMPLVRLLPTESFKTIAEPESDRLESNSWLSSIEDLLTHSTWNDSCEWSLPAGAYEAQFGLVNLGDPDDPRWNNIDGTGQQSAGIWLQKSNTLYRVESGTANKWEIQIPRNVLMCTYNPSRIRENVVPVMMGGGMMGGMGGGGGGFF